MELSIAFINDVHGYLEPHAELFFNNEGPYVKTAGGYARIKTLFDKIKSEEPNTLFFDGGDTFHGTLPVVESKGEVLVPILNRLGLNAMVGHWDFAYTPDHLLKLGAQLDFPILGCNVYRDRGELLLEPYRIFDLKGVKIGVIGICANIIDKTMPEIFRKGIHVTNGMAETPRYVEELRQKGVDVIVLLSHNGYPQDIELLKNTPGIDVCLSAHTHNRIYEQTMVGDTVILQSGCHGSFVGHLQLKIGEGKVEVKKYELITVGENIEEEEGMTALVNTAMEPYQHLRKQYVGTTDHILHRYNTLSSSMDDVLLSAVNFAAGTEIALSNGWRYGIPVGVGNISLWDLYNMVPMNPPVSTVELRGQEIFDLLEENLEHTFAAKPMQQMGGYAKRVQGLKVIMRVENPAGYRIQEIYFRNAPLDRSKTYKVAYLTEQGVARKYGINREQLAEKAIGALKKYLKEHPKVKTAECPYHMV